MFDENALDRNARLSGISKASSNATVGGIGKVGIAVDDDAGISSQLENNFFLSRIILDGSADGSASSKADELDAFVAHE